MMDLHTAKCTLLDLASYAIWRKDEPLPEDVFAEKRVAEAVGLVWKDTFGEDMTWVEKAGMHIPLTDEEKAEARHVTGEMP